jgi:hypothetical protein
LHDGKGKQTNAENGKKCAGNVDVLAGRFIEAFAQEADTDCGGNEAHRNVDEKDPAPVCDVDECTPDDGAESRGQSADRAPDADRGAAALDRELGQYQGE